jgi:hypothetical protein
MFCRHFLWTRPLKLVAPSRRMRAVPGRPQWAPGCLCSSRRIRRVAAPRIPTVPWCYGHGWNMKKTSNYLIILYIYMYNILYNLQNMYHILGDEPITNFSFWSHFEVDRVAGFSPNPRGFHQDWRVQANRRDILRISWGIPMKSWNIYVMSVRSS